jgi:hypothetical protein
MSEQQTPTPARPIASSDGSPVVAPQPGQIVSGSYQPPLEVPGGQEAGQETTATVTGGQTYNVRTTDVLIKADSSSSGAGVAAPVIILPAPPNVGWRITIFWFAWNANQVPPQLQAGGSRTMSPVGGMSSSGQLVASTNLVQTGAAVAYEWDGSDFLQVA